MLSLATSKHTVEAVLHEFIGSKRVAANAIHPSYGRLLQEIERVVFSGGKRLRPHLVFLGYGSYDASISHVAAAHELLHAALLVHDDIIDRDDTRHNQATIHHAYDTHYNPHLKNESEREHFSKSTALLAGDILLSFAHELLAGANLAEEHHQKTVQLIAQGMFEVVGGELLDTEAVFIPETYDPLVVYRYKTAGYSIIAPLLTGAHLSPQHYDTEVLDALYRYAEAIGISYQIQDDILGVFGENDTTGKSTVSDLREGKQTLLISNFKAVASFEHTTLFDEVFGSTESSKEQLVALKSAIQASGARELTEKTAANYMKQALVHLNLLPDSELKASLLELTETLIGRKS